MAQQPMMCQKFSMPGLLFGFHKVYFDMQASASVTKWIQAAGVLLAHGRCRAMTRLKLLKLLYIAERTMIQERDHAFLLDRPVAMRHGPVLSGIYNLIKGEHTEHAAWADFFEADGDLVCLKSEPPRGSLSAYEIRLLQRIADEYAQKDPWEVAQETHSFPEWRDNYPGNNSSATIPWEDIARSLGKDDPEALANEIVHERRLRHSLDEVNP